MWGMELSENQFFLSTDPKLEISPAFSIKLYAPSTYKAHRELVFLWNPIAPRWSGSLGGKKQKLTRMFLFIYLIVES